MQLLFQESILDLLSSLSRTLLTLCLVNIIVRNYHVIDIDDQNCHFSLFMLVEVCVVKIALGVVITFHCLVKSS